MLLCVSGRTALHWAAAVNNEEAARVLIHHHANVDAQDEYSQTALFLAAREGSFEVAKLLLQYGKVNADLPDHMETFPRDVALQRQHHDIARLIEEYAHSSLSTLSLSQAGASAGLAAQPSTGKSRTKKSSSQRKQSVRAVGASAEVDGLLARHHHHARQTSEPDHLTHHLDRAVAAARPKKTKRPKSQSVTQSQRQSAAKLMNVLDQNDVRLFTSSSAVEQPPSYENAINGRRFTAMQQAAAAANSHPVYHTAVPFQEPLPHSFDDDNLAAAYTTPGIVPSLNDSTVMGFLPQQPSGGVVLQPSSYVPRGGLPGEADLSQMIHNSPTVPSCHAYSPQSISAVQGVESTVTSGGVPHSQSLSPIHRQLVQQRMQQHHSHHVHSHQHPMMSTEAASSSTYISPAASAAVVPDVSAYALPTLSSATAAASTNMFQYPTPPSHHSTTTDTTSPSLVHHTTGGSGPNPAVNGYPTPSPDASPGQWSSSSPNSAKSDWSDRAATVTHVTNHSIKNEPAYL